MASRTPEHELDDLPAPATDSAADTDATRAPVAVTASALAATQEEPPPYHQSTRQYPEHSASLETTNQYTLRTCGSATWNTLCQHRASLLGWAAITGGFVLAVLALIPAFISQAVTERQYKLDKWQALKEFFDYCKEEKEGGHVPKDCEETANTDIPLPPGVNFDKEFNKLVTRIPRSVQDSLNLGQASAPPIEPLSVVGTFGLTFTLWVFGLYSLNTVRRKRLRRRAQDEDGVPATARSSIYKCLFTPCPCHFDSDFSRNQHMVIEHGWTYVDYKTGRVQHYKPPQGHHGWTQDFFGPRNVPGPYTEEEYACMSPTVHTELDNTPVPSYANSLADPSTRQEKVRPPQSKVRILDVKFVLPSPSYEAHETDHDDGHIPASLSEPFEIEELSSSPWPTHGDNQGDLSSRSFDPSQINVFDFLVPSGSFDHLLEETEWTAEDEKALRQHEHDLLEQVRSARKRQLDERDEVSGITEAVRSLQEELDRTKGIRQRSESKSESGPLKATGSARRRTWARGLIRKRHDSDDEDEANDPHATNQAMWSSGLESGLASLLREPALPSILLNSTILKAEVDHDMISSLLSKWLESDSTPVKTPARDLSSGIKRRRIRPQEEDELGDLETEYRKRIMYGDDPVLRGNPVWRDKFDRELDSTLAKSQIQAGEGLHGPGGESLERRRKSSKKKTG